MIDFIASVPWTFYAFVLGLAAIAALRAFMSVRSVTAEAKDEYKVRKPDVSEDVFTKAWVNTYALTGGFYVAAAAILALVLTPIWFMAFDFVWHQIWLLSDEHPFIKRGRLWWYIFVMISTIFFWVFMFRTVLRLYYKSQVVSLDDEIKRLSTGDT